MSVDFEPAVNSDQDMVTMNKPIFFAAGAGKPEANMFLNMYLYSPLKEQQYLGQQAQGRLDRFYNNVKGVIPRKTELDMIKTGMTFFSININKQSQQAAKIPTLVAQFLVPALIFD